MMFALLADLRTKLALVCASRFQEYVALICSTVSNDWARIAKMMPHVCTDLADTATMLLVEFLIKPFRWL